VDYYRKTRATDYKALSAISEKTAITEGFAIKEHRVYKLSLLAALLEKDLFGGILWTNEVKGIGGAENFEVIEYEQFNKAEVDAYRGVLDDIAAETGGRIKNVDVKSNGQEIGRKVTDEQFDTAIQGLIKAIGTGVHNPDDGKKSPLDTAKR